MLPKLQLAWWWWDSDMNRPRLVMNNLITVVTQTEVAVEFNVTDVEVSTADVHN